MHRIEYDKEADAIYIHLSTKPCAYTEKIDDFRYVDYAGDNTPVGIELLCVSKGVTLEGIPQLETMQRAFQERNIKVYA